MALLLLDQPLRTHSGEPFCLLTTTARGTYPIVGYVGDAEQLTYFDAKGVAMYGHPRLENVAVEGELWVVKYVTGAPVAYSERTNIPDDGDILAVVRLPFTFKPGQRDDLNNNQEGN